MKISKVKHKQSMLQKAISESQKHVDIFILARHDLTVKPDIPEFLFRWRAYTQASSSPLQTPY